MIADLERFEALFGDPGYDGAEIDLGVALDDLGVWMISAGGPIKASHEASAARCTRWWREHPGGLPEPVAGECGDGYGSAPQSRAVETVAVAGGLL